jgi:protein deglycase
MKGLVLLADGFEDTEAIATLDILARSQIHMTLASVMDTEQVISQYQIPMQAQVLLKDVYLDEFDFLFIPGGKAVSQHLATIELVRKTIHAFHKKNKLIAAICAAPSLIGRDGLLASHRYTCFPGFEKQVVGGTYLTDEGVVVDPPFITGKSMAYSIRFGLAIVEYLQGEQQKNRIQKQIFGN